MWSLPVHMWPRRCSVSKVKDARWAGSSKVMLESFFSQDKRDEVLRPSVVSWSGRTPRPSKGHWSVMEPCGGGIMWVCRLYFLPNFPLIESLIRKEWRPDRPPLKKSIPRPQLVKVLSQGIWDRSCWYECIEPCQRAYLRKGHRCSSRV